MAFYLKYRPQKIAELDSEAVRRALGEILAAKEIPHAFLFVGPKGTGKTSSARIVAKSINCLAPKKGEPCNRCDNCRAINEGGAIDLIEIDAASHRGIDDIRDLREKIKLTPSQTRFKTYIIDEVHMLTREAFNALLKTLEEPPKHAVFVLCTTEPDKIPGTIASRCLRIDFHKAKPEEIVRSLKKIVKGENLSIKSEDLNLIAKWVDGSFRDGAKILEQLALTGKRISSKRVEEVLRHGLASFGVDDWLISVYRKQTQAALEKLGRAWEQGVEPQRLVEEVLERLRQVYLVRLEVDKQEEDIPELDNLEQVRKLAQIFIKAGREIRGALLEVLPLELAIMEWGEIESKSKEKVELAEESEPEPKTEKSVPASTRPAKLSRRSGKVDIKSVQEKWEEVLRVMRPHNYSLEALLRATKPTGFEGKCLVLEVFYRFHKERLEIERYRKQVESVVSEVLDQPVSIRYYLSEKRPERHELKEAKATEADNVGVEVRDDILKTAEEVFGVKVN